MNLLKNILLISYLKNKGVRRICFVIGVLLTIIPTYIWYENLNDNFYNETYKNIEEFVHKPWNRYNQDKQREVFNKYPVDIGYKDLTQFDLWKSFFFDQSGPGYAVKIYYLEQCNIKKNDNNANLPEGFHVVYTPDNNNDYWNQFEEVDPLEYDKNKVTPEMLLAGARNLKKRGYTPEQVDAWLHTHNSSLKKIKEFAKEEKFNCNKFEQYMTQEICISKANYIYLLKLLWSLFWFYLPFLLACIVRWIYTGFKDNKAC
ncbi:MAG: hypothetical protein J6W96_03090 [Alphaproteobacteria bacterium]|nr:hypothetical protein [Alphaproteobacteria bacterium]